MLKNILIAIVPLTNLYNVNFSSILNTDKMSITSKIYHLFIFFIKLVIVIHS